MLKTTITLLLSAMTVVCSAQTDNKQTMPRPTWQQYFDQLNDIDDMESSNLEELYDQMCELEDSPVNLNSASADDIKRLMFLNAAQAEELTEYIDRHRPLRSIGELAMIKSIDPIRLQLLMCFTYIGEETDKKGYPKLGDILKYGKHDVVATAKIPFYTRKGDRDGYIGSKYKHWTRYTFRYGQYLQIGFLGTQDSGEPFFAHGNDMGYDHYAYYAVIRKLGRLKTLALGQYKLRFGMGLAMNTGFTLGKTTAATMSVPNNSITPNSSRSDAYYLQGAATTIEVSRNMDITAFASYRKIDATLNKDGTIKTLLKTGYHRTESEMQRKHNASQTTTGGNIRWHSGGWHVGLTGVYTAYSDSLKPDKRQAYRKYNPTGIHFYNTSVDYGYINHRVNINGETAINDKGAVATINAIALKASQSLTLTAIQRFYSYRYYSMFSSAFSDGGKVQNESGIYLGAMWTPSSRLSVLAYSDYAYFPWARYLVSERSHSWDNMIQASYRLSPLLTLNSRYRLRMREEDYNDKELKSKYLIDKTEHRARLSLVYANTHWSAKTQGDVSYVVYPDELSDKPSSFGWMVSQNMAYTNSWISAAANIGYFHTHDYNSRIYTYENGTLYTFSFPMFYGEGMRGAMLLRGNIGSHLIILCKVGATKYFDRDKISSSYQQINSSWQADIDLQIRWKL